MRHRFDTSTRSPLGADESSAMKSTQHRGEFYIVFVWTPASPDMTDLATYNRLLRDPYMRYRNRVVGPDYAAHIVVCQIPRNESGEQVYAQMLPAGVSPPPDIQILNSISGTRWRDIVATQVEAHRNDPTIVMWMTQVTTATGDPGNEYFHVGGRITAFMAELRQQYRHRGADGPDLIYDRPPNIVLWPFLVSTMPRTLAFIHRRREPANA